MQHPKTGNDVFYGIVPQTFCVIYDAVYKGGLDGDGGDALLVRLEQLQDGVEIAGKSLVNETPPLFVHKAAEGVVAVQVNSDHDLHRGSPVG